MGGGTITYNDHLRDALIPGGLACEIILILSGIVYDLIVTAQNDKDDLQAMSSEFDDADLANEEITMSSFTRTSVSNEVGGGHRHSLASSSPADANAAVAFVPENTSSSS